MKIRKSIIALLSLTLCAGAWAASSTGNISTSTTSSASMWDKLKESPFSLLLLSDNYTGKNDKNQFNGMQSDNYIFAGYKLTDKDSIRLTVVGSIKDNDEARTVTKMEDYEFRYKRSKILTEDANGINLAWELRLHRFTPKFEDNKKRTGSIDTRVSMSKSFGKFTIAPGLRLYKYIKTAGHKDANESIRDRSYIATLVPSYAITDKLTAATMLYYRHNMYKVGTSAGQAVEEFLRVVPSIGYDVTKDLNVEGYWDAYPMMVAGDDQTFMEDWQKANTSWGMTLSYSMF